MMSKMEFDCKLAHLNKTRRISGFNSIKELYEKVSQAFSLPIEDILFCTLNTHNFRDMDSLLGNYLSIKDLIVVHLCGNSRDLNLTKTEEYLGLTITDNGHGRAFVKKVKSNGDLIEQMIKPGDHIAAINSESTVGMRHYEVAKAIREVPQSTKFTLRLVEPLYLESEISAKFGSKLAPDLKNNQMNISLLNFTETNDRNFKALDDRDAQNQPGQTKLHTYEFDSLCEDLINSSLPIDRLLSRENQTFPNEAGAKNGQDSYRATIEKINSILECFLGINDNTLAIQMYRLAKENKDSFSLFVNAIENSELSVFNFDEDIKTYLWNCAVGSSARPLIDQA